MSIATGTTMASTGLTAPDALALLRAYAYSHDTTAADIAANLAHAHLDVTDISY